MILINSIILIRDSREGRMKKKTTRVPRQIRSIETKNSIKKAALRLFGEKGIHSTNSNEIAKEAGASVGSFYAYFHDKHMLLLDILKDYLDEFIKIVWQNSFDESSPRLPLKDQIKKILTKVFIAYSKLPMFHQETHALRYSDRDVKIIFENERQLEVEQIKKIIAAYKDLIRVSDIDAAAIVLHGAAESAAHAIMFGNVPIEKNRLINELTNMFYTYLTQGES